MKARSFLLMFLVAGAAVAEPAILPEARSKFQAGAAMMSDPDGARMEEAYRLFKEAYAISPSWKMLGNIGLSAMKLERHQEALEALQRYLGEGGTEIDAVERTQVERDLRTLRSGSGVLSISLPPGDATAVVEDARSRADGGVVTNTYSLARNDTARLLVALGRHKLTLRDGDRVATWEGEVGTSGAAVTLAFGAPAAASAEPVAVASSAAPVRAGGRSTARTAGTIAVGVGGALIVSGVVTAVLGQRKKVALDDACPNKVCPEDRRGDVDTLRAYTTATNVLLIGGAVVATAGAATIVWARGDRASVVVSPVGVDVRGRFLRCERPAKTRGGDLLAELTVVIDRPQLLPTCRTCIKVPADENEGLARLLGQDQCFHARREAVERAELRPPPKVGDEDSGLEVDGQQLPCVIEHALGLRRVLMLCPERRGTIVSRKRSDIEIEVLASVPVVWVTLGGVLRTRQQAFDDFDESQGRTGGPTAIPKVLVAIRRDALHQCPNVDVVNLLR